MNIEIGDKKIDFVYQGDNLIYPNYPARENLILHYDFSGMKNSDVTKDIARDLSGNGNNGELQNFAYIDESGYLDNELIFDGIDDFITIPEPQIDLDNFTYSEGINVLSFRGDEVATVVDGVVEIGGRNYVLNSDFSEGQKHWILQYERNALFSNNTLTLSSDNESSTENDSVYQNLKIERDVRVIGSVLVKGEGVLRLRFGEGDAFRQDFAINSPDEFINIHAIFPHTGNQNFMIMLVGKGELVITNVKLERGTKATDWTPAPEDLEMTTFKPLFDKKIKSALYWNRALTDEELLQVYNIQIKRT